LLPFPLEPLISLKKFAYIYMIHIKILQISLQQMQW
jgi:hypothetical protein